MKFLAVVVIGLGLCAGLRAETTDPVGGSAHGFSGSGTIYAVDNQTGDGSFTITGIDGPGVTGLIGAGGFFGNDNLLFSAGSPSLSAAGFSFTDTMGNTDFQVNLFGNADGSYGIHVLDSDGLSIDDVATFTLGSPAMSSAHGFMRQRNTSSSAPQAFSFSFASADAVAETPEPSSLALLGTGVLGMAVVLRKRGRLPAVRTAAPAGLALPSRPCDGAPFPAPRRVAIRADYVCA